MHTAVLNLFLFSEIYDLVILVGLAAVVGLGFVQTALQGVLERKTGLSWKRFILLAYVPSAAGSIVYFIVVRILDMAGYFKGFLAGLGELLIGISWTITSVAALIAGLIVYVSRVYAREEKGKL